MNTRDPGVDIDTKNDLNNTQCPAHETKKKMWVLFLKDMKYVR